MSRQIHEGKAGFKKGGGTGIGSAFAKGGMVGSLSGQRNEFHGDTKARVGRDRGGKLGD